MTATFLTDKQEQNDDYDLTVFFISAINTAAGKTKICHHPVDILSVKIPYLDMKWRGLGENIQELQETGIVWFTTEPWISEYNLGILGLKEKKKSNAFVTSFTTLHITIVNL